MKKLFFILMLLIAISISYSYVCNSQTDEEIDSRVYYKVFYGKESGNYTHQSDKIYDTNFSAKDLDPDTTYYFVIKSYDSSENESDYSQEVSAKTFALPDGGSGVDIPPITPPGGGGGSSASCFINTILMMEEQ